MKVFPWEVTRRTDLPGYELSDYCSNPFCSGPASDNHHVDTKGMGWPKKSDYWHVESPSGQVIPARVGLCRPCHQSVTGTVGGYGARIQWIEEESLFYWIDLRTNEGQALDPHPPLSDRLESPRPASEAIAEPGESLPPSAPLCPHAALEPGQKCEGCGKRKPYPKKAESPVSKPLVLGRAPIDEHESLKQMVDDLAAGPFSSMRYPQAKVLEAGLYLLTQLSPEAVEGLVRERWGEAA
jgi:hypothetical protein